MCIYAKIGRDRSVRPSVNFLQALSAAISLPRFGVVKYFFFGTVLPLLRRVQPLPQCLFLSVIKQFTDDSIETTQNTASSFIDELFVINAIIGLYQSRIRKARKQSASIIVICGNAISIFFYKPHHIFPSGSQIKIPSLTAFDGLYGLLIQTDPISINEQCPPSRL